MAPAFFINKIVAVGGPPKPLLFESHIYMITNNYYKQNIHPSPYINTTSHTGSRQNIIHHRKKTLL